MRRMPSASFGKVWVCSSATICSRCSTRRRNQYAGVSSAAAAGSMRLAVANACSAAVVAR